MRYAFFVGCTTLARLSSYEISTRKVAEALGMELLDMEGSGCCGTTYLKCIDRKTGLALAARNISIAEDMGMNIVTLCNGCTEVLTDANNTLKEDDELRDDVNDVLSEVDRQFRGTVEVKHFVRAFLEDLGIDKIQARVSNPLEGLRVAVHYGCHLLKPFKIMNFDDPEDPTSLDEMVNITGAVSVDYPGKLDCCTAPLLTMKRRNELAVEIAREKLSAVKKYADIMITVCPFCYLMYEQSQLPPNDSYDIPIVHYPQLLGLSMGIDFQDLALNENRVDPSVIKNYSK
ncbi:MAG: CoB--CoM heterodisulfide reductase iron-sulfur subunit B family protein [Candidatus Jordarchaeum sp.]|uniref:CoB--CoM heterodisulfide reductase iron-sulfur subunit B family protein n=1 Tax=Candidatus Jordarchaeum sp. TaxID=2823881 RepID=UPI00404B8B87